MGSPVDFRFVPIFVAEKIDDITFDGYRVAVGEEAGGCSFFTKAAIVEYPNINDGDLQRLRDDLKKKLIKAEE